MPETSDSTPLKDRGLSERAEIARTRQRQFGEAEAPSGQQSREAIPAGSEKAAASEASFIDAELSLTQITYRLHDEINKLAPFGIGNRKPVFLFKSVKPASVRRFGKGNEHIELSFNVGGNDQSGAGKKVSAISFFGVNNEWADKVKADQSLDLIASVEKSMFRGRPELRLRVVDVLYL